MPYSELDAYRLVPAGETEFSKDAAFGYKSSNLCEVCFFCKLYQIQALKNLRKCFYLFIDLPCTIPVGGGENRWPHTSW